MVKMYVLTNDLSFEIAESDFPELLLWSDALKCGAQIEPGWRLPTKAELDLMYKLHTKAIGGFKFEYYWSSEGSGDFFANAKNFKTGQYTMGVSSKSPAPKYRTRMVKNI